MHCYQHASIEIQKLKNHYWKYKFYRYKKCYKYFSSKNRQKKFLSKKYSELNLKEKLKIPEFKTMQIELDLNMWNSKNSDFFEFIKIYSPYKNLKYRKLYLTFNLPIKHHKHSNKYKSWERKNTIFLHKDLQGRYWLKFVYDKKISLKSQGASLGIDVGYKKLITTSRKEFIGTQDLNKIYNKISKKKQGSKNFRQSLIHRNEFINYLVNKMDLKNINKIYVEDLKNLRFTSRKAKFVYRHTLNKLSRFSEENGVLFRKVDPANTSRRCSNCGAIHEESRNKELYSCIECKIQLDADYNAALNILHRGEGIRNGSDSTMIPLTRKVNF